MIQKHEVIDLFITACPSYKERWLQYVSESYEDVEEHLLYVDYLVLSSIALHLIWTYFK